MDLRSNGPKKNHKKGIAAMYKEKLRTEAEARQAKYKLLTVEQKIAKLDAGGFTASKQRYKFILEQTAALTKK